MTEIWKDVIGYEGLYQVSNLGRVMRVAGGMGATPGRILKPWLQNGGYLQVTLSANDRRKVLSVHRLVAEALLERPSPAHNEVNHKNGVKSDPRVENLEWVTRKQNLAHRETILGISSKGEANGLAKLADEDVIEIRELYATGKYTQVELGEMFQVSFATISDIVRRETWQHIGGPQIQGGISRHAKGEANGRSKLTQDDVRKIRLLYARGEYSQRELGRMFGVSQRTIGRIIHSETWQHVS